MDNDDVYIGRVEWSARLGFGRRPMDIDKLEAGRELDVLVADNVMGGYESKTIGFILPPGKRLTEAHADFDKVPHYSTEIGAAWKVVEKVGLWVGPFTPGVYWSAVSIDDYLNSRATKAASAPLAICRAALKAVQK